MASECVAVCAHVQASAFLFQGLRKGGMSGISSQTVLALTVSATTLVIKKLWWKVDALAHHRQPSIKTTWEINTAGFFVNAVLLMMSLYMLRKKQAGPKDNVEKDKEEVQDDFGRKATHHMWFKVFGQTRSPPACSHWGLIYLGAFFLSFVTALASCSFSLAALVAWAIRRPTAMMAIYENYIRGLLVLPQLHVSQKAGVVPPALALWIAMQGFVDIVELAADGIQLANMCYMVGDFMSLLFVSDYLWLFLKSKLRGQKFVDIQMYEV